MTSPELHSKLRLAPLSPGVYLFRNAAGVVIYVGKASNLRNRVKSYFGSKSALSTKTVRLVAMIADVEFIIASTEQEALVLEADLIKQHRPQYNARLKDDKSFPFLKVDVRSEWPTVSVVRRRVDDGSRYFGPFASARAVRQTLRVVRRVFRFRLCSGPLDGTRSKACLNYDIGLCPAPCIGAITHEEYRKTVEHMVLFLEGRYRDVLDSLRAEMNEASEKMDFERAALFRDRVQAVDLVTNRNVGVTALRGDQDIIAVAQESSSALVEVFSVREGKVQGRQDFPVEGTGSLAAPEVLRSFVLQYYRVASTVPPTILLQHIIDDMSLVRSMLAELRHGSVQMIAPRTGVRKQLVDNVADSVSRQLLSFSVASGRGLQLRDAGLKELKDVLGLGSIPHRIEGFDISTTQGTESVGSLVVFEDGVPKPSDYRRFRIRTVSGQDDYSMMHEVLLRRFSKLGRSGSVSKSVKASNRWGDVPSLVLVDGGRGQLGVALQARHECGVDGIPIIGLAKEHEYVYSESRSEPMGFVQDSPGLRILQAVRDEAHRFAITYHRGIRRASMIVSALDSVPGIGPSRKKALLRAFGTVDSIRQASVDELVQKAGLPIPIARRLSEWLAAHEE
ncbi:MAG: excinuclease ABC subunit UvrC [Dehalococcoidia bacterium]|nr:excinuclease ABC subunit UvrC [Dehalococcoidia bacterium]